MKRAIAGLLVGIARAGCGGAQEPASTESASTTATGTASGEAAPAAAGTGVLTERTFGDMAAKISAPERAKDGYSGLMIELTKSDGTPVTGATITATSSMPEHNMDGPDMTSEDKGAGKYWLPGGDMMKGKWLINLSVKTADGKSATDSAEVVLP